MKFEKNTQGNWVLTFTSNVYSDTSFSSINLGEYTSTMEYFPSDDGEGGIIEWDIPDLEDTEHIGISVENGELYEYDGIFNLPSQAIALLEHIGIIVPDNFKD